jgi:hypothetical protein
MYETYRMLGREHEADLEREAQNRRRAAELRGRGQLLDAVPRTARRRTRVYPVLARVAAFVARA